jgi:hypothetical protein
VAHRIRSGISGPRTDSEEGILYVDDVLLANTAFADDVLNPIHDSSVSAILEPLLSCTVFDGTTDADLVMTARIILCDERMRIAAGPAGLAGAIAQTDRPAAYCCSSSASCSPLS